MRQFSTEHLAALAALVALVIGCVWAGRRASERSLVLLSRALALVILAAWAGEYLADVDLGIWSVQYTLPLQLTDVVSLCAVLALLTRRQLLVELTYFWAFTASLQALITPDLGQTFPSAFYFTYFGYHIGAVAAASLLVFGCGIYPRPGAVWRVWGVTLLAAAVAAIGDLLTGGNYMYLREKPVHASLLNVLGPWPWYIVATTALGLAMLLCVAVLTEAGRRVPQLLRRTAARRPA